MQARADLSSLKTEPFWREAAALDPGDSGELPAKVDVVVIGGGLTGLAAAARFAAAGRETVVLEAEALGFGASARNGGMIGWGHRAKIDDLSRRYGEETALGLLGEARASYEFTRGLIDEISQEHGVDCRYRMTGRFLGAATPRIYDALAREVEALSARLGFDARMVSQGDQAAEIVSDSYFGGVVFPEHGALHPGLLVNGLAMRARAAGARLFGAAAVERIEKTGSGWRLARARGAIEARDLALATNGYSGIMSRALPDLANRVIPLPSYMIATQPLGAERIRALMPGGRSYVDTRSTHSYFRADPDGERILWGGRASLRQIPLPRAAETLKRHMSSVFPSLRDVGLTHAWSGHIAYTEDVVPHVGRLDRGPLEGAAFALGYCGSGVAMAPWLGDRMARLVLGDADAAGPFGRTRFRPVPGVWGVGPALIAIEAWHKFADWRAGIR